MEKYYLITAIIASVGFLAGWLLRIPALAKAKRDKKNIEDLLQQQKSHHQILKHEFEVLTKSHKEEGTSAHNVISEMKKQQEEMKQELLLLQIKNEETESLLKTGQPVIHSLKLKLIEANNNIARYKAKLGAVE